jgi:hypothetical protein
MDELEEATKARINALMSAELAKTPNRSREIHEAGHAVAAVHLDLSLGSVDVEEKDSPEGWKIGGAHLREMPTIFSEKELRQKLAYVIEHVRKRVVLLLAFAEARILIEGGAEDKFAQFDQSAVRGRREE